MSGARREVDHVQPAKLGGYHRMSIAQKQAAALARAREPSVMCPCCDTQVTPADLLGHLEQRCSGPREPGPGAKWVTWREALALGVPKNTLVRWVKQDLVRAIGPKQDRRYLLRDLVVRLSARRARQRR